MSYLRTVGRRFQSSNPCFPLPPKTHLPMDKNSRCSLDEALGWASQSDRLDGSTIPALRPPLDG